MPFSKNDQDELRKYLLGQIVDEDRRQTIEQRLLTDDEYFEELEIVESELIDDYVDGSASNDERKLFEQNFLTTPERRAQLRFAQTLAQSAAHQPVPAPGILDRLSAFWNGQTWFLRMAGVAASVLIVAGLFWIARPPSPKTFATFTLNISNVERSQGGAATIIKLPLEADALRLQLMIPEGAVRGERYRAELVRENGQKQTLTPIEQNAQSVTVEISANEISRGQYAINLYAVRPDGTEERIKGSYLLTAAPRYAVTASTTTFQR